MAKSLEWYGAQIEKKIERAIGKGLDRLAAQVQEKAKRSMTETELDPSRDYRRKGNRRFVTASSAPYHPPAVQRGRLQKSVHIRRRGKYERQVGSRVPYALYLEVGTSRMIERPWLRPALYEVTGQTGDEIWEGLLDRS